MKEIKLYNRLTRSVDVFKPVKEGQVGIYSCGPTVYHYAHIGNLRSMIFADILVRTFRYAGYDVNWVMNITDVGHLKGDGDDGIDKMEQAAKSENKSIWEIAKYYENEFWKDWEYLNLSKPTYTPHATDFIQQEIDFVKELEKNGFTYITGDGVYFDTSKYPDYANLSGLNIDGQDAGHRVDMGEKKHASDFALWKFSKPEEHRQMEWNSPWGIGFPGWSIECSTMGTSLIGPEIDIHTGGEDLVSVHHSNERAQNFGRFGTEVVKRWMHGGMLVTSNGNKMAKSDGNFLQVKNLVDANINPLSYRYLCLTSSYAKQLSYSSDIIVGAENAYKNLLKQTQKYADINIKNVTLSQESLDYIDKFENAIFNDLNTAVSLTVLRDMLNSSISNEEKAVLTYKFDSIFGLKLLSKPTEKNTESIPNEIIELAELRLKAKQEKNFSESDKIRNQLTELGWKIIDISNGYKLEKL